MTREQRMERVRQRGLRVRAARNSRGLTPDQLAARAGLDRSRLDRLERGTCDVAAEELAAVGRALGLPLWYVFEVPSADTGTGCPVCGRDDPSS